MQSHRTSTVFILLALLVAGPACKKNAPATAGPAGTAFDQRWPACDPSATTQTMSFVHINDLHSNYQLEPSGVSPYARVRGYYLSVKKENPYTIFTSAGDEYEKGAVAEQITQGLSTRQILWGMQFDIRVIGNHDYGWSEQEVLAESLDPYAQVLSTSVHYAGTPASAFGAKDYVEAQIGCVKVGFFGLTTWSYNDQDQAQMVNYYPDMPTNLNFTQVAGAQIAAHRKDVDLLVAIDHIGWTEDTALALAMSGDLDVILSGHSHDLIMSIDPSANGGASIIQSGAFASDINRLDVTYDLKKKAIVGTPVYTITPIEDTSRGAPPAPDPATQAMVTGVLNKLAPNAQTPIANVQTTVSDYNMVATIAAHAGMQTFNADAAIVDTSTVWDSIPAGPISQQDCYNAFRVEREPPGTPGFNSFYTVNIDGASLQTLTSVSRSGWVVVPPTTTIDPARTYVLVGQKRTLNHPDIYLPAGVTISGTPTAASEVWYALSTYAKARQAACQYVDVDAMIPGCTPG